LLTCAGPLLRPGGPTPCRSSASARLPDAGARTPQPLLAQGGIMLDAGVLIRAGLRPLALVDHGAPGSDWNDPAPFKAEPPAVPQFCLWHCYACSRRHRELPGRSTTCQCASGPPEAHWQAAHWQEGICTIPCAELPVIPQAASATSGCFASRSAALCTPFTLRLAPTRIRCGDTQALAA
jgi:hypothetical protein